MNNKYKETAKTYENPTGSFFGVSGNVNYRMNNIRLDKLLKKVLHNNDIDLDIRCKDFHVCGFMMKSDHVLKIKYNGKLVFNYPDWCYGVETEVFKMGKFRTYNTISDDYGLYLGEYIEEYINTPKDRLLSLPSGPYGIYEILLAADKRIKLDRLKAISLTFKSVEALQILGIRSIKEAENKNKKVEKSS